MTDVIKNKIRSYKKRKPNLEKKLKFANDLIKRAVYNGNRMSDKWPAINKKSLQYFSVPIDTALNKLRSSSLKYLFILCVQLVVGLVGYAPTTPAMST